MARRRLAPTAADVCFRSPLQTAPPPGSPADRHAGIVSADSMTIRLHELRITSHQSRIKCHTMPSLFRPNSLKTNDPHPHEVSHFFEVGKHARRAPRALPGGARRAEREKSGNRYALRASFFTSNSFGLDSRTPAPEDSGYCGCGDEGRTLGASRWGMTVSDYRFERGGCA